MWFNDATDRYVVSEQDKESGQDLRPHDPPPEPRLQPSPAHPTLDREDMINLLAEQQGSLVRERLAPEE